MSSAKKSTIELPGQVEQIVCNLPGVKSVMSGEFKIGGGTTGGSRQVKIGISPKKIPSVWLLVRQGNAVAELHIFGNGTLQETMLAIARALRNNKIPITFLL